MNAQSIWAGEEYAFYPYKGNQAFMWNARRLRAVKVTKRREFGNSKMSSFVEGVELDKETGDVLRDGAVIEVRTRDVIDFWEDYSNELAAKNRKRQEEREVAERMRQQQEAERMERLRREEAERTERLRVDNERRENLIAKMVDRGIPREAIYSVSATNIILDRTVMEVWLSIERPVSAN
jgi:hypothetical protein